jgi:hypothetical protein
MNNTVKAMSKQEFDGICREFFGREIDPDSEIKKSESNDLMKMVQLTAMNVNSISEQMGLVLTKVNNHDERIVALEDRMTSHERTETINRAQARRIKKAVVEQVNKVLGIKYEGGKVADECVRTEVLYRSGFIARLYTDAKNHSKMGGSYTETLKVDFDEVMEYIAAWRPEVEGGVEVVLRRAMTHAG